MTQVIGCLFHLAQSVLRGVQKEGLAKFFKDDSFREGFHQLIGLAFVPEEDVPAVFDSVVQELDER